MAKKSEGLWIAGKNVDSTPDTANKTVSVSNPRTGLGLTSRRAIEPLTGVAWLLILAVLGLALAAIVIVGMIMAAQR